ncbi:hypothetical protein PRIPAC_84970 [Pristionchus pacificus]|uniref:Peptidase n=1 Tax=Pristionchus pacificus TaxID=54126 RepID=A0A2A6BU28_PRIPA|nr:hypothetical protein PRIPAC_84970 [Pristionchus pacificus]|eukprot:PDM69313.1 Peptidase [Pristionchus pacificus]
MKWPRILQLLAVLISTALGYRTAHFDLQRYNDFPDFQTYLVRTSRDNPGIVRLLHIGNSHEGRPLLGVMIGKPRNHKKPMVWLDGGNHAREWPAFHVAVYFIEQLVNNYDSDKKIKMYLDELDFLIFPVLNPDGFVYSRSDYKATIRHWRKNRAPENCTGTTASRKELCCEGVDLNRNYDFAFSQSLYPFNNPCSDEYQGPEPFSEPESRAVRDFILSPQINGRLHAVVSLHTHGQLLILPYNSRRRTYPEDFWQLKELADRAAEAMAGLRNTKYKVKYVYVIELPPDMKTWFAFQIKPHWLIPIGKETWSGIKVIVDQVIREFVDK